MLFYCSHLFLPGNDIYSWRINYFLFVLTNKKQNWHIKLYFLGKLRERKENHENWWTSIEHVKCWFCPTNVLRSRIKQLNCILRGFSLWIIQIQKMRFTRKFKYSTTLITFCFQSFQACALTTTCDVKWNEVQLKIWQKLLKKLVHVWNFLFNFNFAIANNTFSWKGKDLRSQINCRRLRVSYLAKTKERTRYVN